MDSVAQGSELCSVCNEEGKTTPAIHWCSECEALFCDGCLKMHSKMPNSKKHQVVPVSEKKPRQKKFICKEHNKKMKLYCRDCDKPLCTVCCSIAHRTCKEVITIQDQLPEVKSRLQRQKQNLAEKIDLTKGEFQKLDLQEKNLLADRSMLESEIRKSIKQVIDALKLKEDQLVSQVKDRTEQDTQMLRSMMKTNQLDLKLYQQQSQSIQQALELEDEAQLFEMYLSSGSGAVADITDTQGVGRSDVSHLSFIDRFDNLKKEIEMIDVKIQHIDNIDLRVAPVLDEVIDIGVSSSVVDCLVMNSADSKVTLVAYGFKNVLKSFYTKGRQICSSELKVSGTPRRLTSISKSKAVVSLNNPNQIITVAVTPDLTLLSTVQTSKKYSGLSTLDQSTLVAGSKSPPSVDMIDMQGNIMRTFTTLPTIGKNFNDPHYIHVTTQGNILVSDYGLESVICLTQYGDIVFTYTPTGDKALMFPYGITTTSTGDIIVAVHNKDKVIHLSTTGQFIRDVLTKRNGVQNQLVCVLIETNCVLQCGTRDCTNIELVRLSGS